VSYLLKRGKAAGRYCSGGHAYTFEQGQEHQLNDAQAKAFAHVVEQAKATKQPRKGSK